MTGARRAIGRAQAALGLARFHPVQFDCQELAAGWPSRWSPQSVAAQPGRLQVKRAAGNVFMYVEEGRADLLDDRPEERTELVELSPAELVEACARQTADGAGAHYYFTARVESAFPELMPASWSWLVVDRWDRVPAERLGYLSAWIGGAGSTTQAHYDVAHNVFVQMYGTKRFRCWPPAAMHQFKVYPDAHPRARKSQLRVDEALAAGSLQPPSCDLVLQPGQAVFIPAFWFHHVEANEAGPSIGLNCFSQAKVTNAVAKVLARPAPRLDGLEQYAELTRRLLSGVQTNPNLAGEMLQSRYGQTARASSAVRGELSEGVEVEVQRYVEELERGLGREAGEDRAYYDGVLELSVAHLLELIALRNFSADKVSEALAYAATLDSG